ncbi:MAG: hypothetical protein ACI4I9_00640 [Porcipelethomonas sp.]
MFYHLPEFFLDERKRLQQKAVEEMDENWLKEIDEENITLEYVHRHLGRGAVFMS